MNTFRYRNICSCIDAAFYLCVSIYTYLCTHIFPTNITTGITCSFTTTGTVSPIRNASYCDELALFPSNNNDSSDSDNNNKAHEIQISDMQYLHVKCGIKTKWYILIMKEQSCQECYFSVKLFQFIDKMTNFILLQIPQE